MNETLARELVASLTAELQVGAAPVVTTMAAGRRVRRQRRALVLTVATVATVGTLVLGGLMLRTDGPRESIDPVTDTLSHAWWAEGTLHLAGGTVPLSGARAFVQIPGGVVVLTDDGEVRRVDDGGTNRLIGRWRTGAPRDDLQPTVRAQDDGTVVWLDGTGATYAFVVHDPASGDRMASHSIPTGGFHEAAWLNELEDGVVYWDSAAYGQRAWDIATDKVTKIGKGETLLVALESGVRVTNNETADGIEIASDGQRLWTVREGGGWLSPDAATLVTLSGPPTQLRARDALTGKEVAAPIDVPIDDSIVLASVHLGDENTLAYVLGTMGDEVVGAPYDLISCDLTSSRCTTVVDDAVEQPLLPSD